MIGSAKNREKLARALQKIGFPNARALSKLVHIRGFKSTNESEFLFEDGRTGGYLRIRGTLSSLSRNIDADFDETLRIIVEIVEPINASYSIGTGLGKIPPLTGDRQCHDSLTKSTLMKTSQQ